MNLRSASRKSARSVRAGAWALLFLALGVSAKPCSAEDAAKILIKDLHVHLSEFPTQHVHVDHFKAPSGDPTLRLAPNGKDLARLSFRVEDGAGRGIEGAPVTVEVIAKDKSPYRSKDEARKQAALWKNMTDEAWTDTWAKIRPIGTVTSVVPRQTQSSTGPLTLKSGFDGYALIEYRSSHVAGDDLGKEDIVITSGLTASATVHVELGLDLVDLRDKAFTFTRVTFKDKDVKAYAHRFLADYLVALDKEMEAASFPAIVITDISSKYGGILAPHLSHGDGLAMDLWAVGDDPTKVAIVGPSVCGGKVTTDNYGTTGQANTMILLRLFRDAGASKILFNDPRAQPEYASCYHGHNDHMHVEFRPHITPRFLWIGKGRTP